MKLLIPLTIQSTIKDYGEISIAVFVFFWGLLVYVIKKIFEYLMLKSDIRSIKEAQHKQGEMLELLLNNQNTIKLEVELIKNDLEHKKIRKPRYNGKPL